MAFKLKSPFHANVVTVKNTLGQGGRSSMGKGSSGLTNPGLDVYSTPGEQNVNKEPTNKTTDDLVEKADKGVPVSLNPKQKARFETKKYKKGIRDDAKFKRQTEKAKKIYERNQFENLDGGFKNPEEAAGIKSDRAEKSLERDSKFKILESDLPFEEKEKMINDIDSKSKFSNTKKSKDKEKKSPPKDNLVMRSEEEEFKNPIFQMKGKPNRAGTPARMLKSMEDTTPMKYKSVRKAGRENLMSALAKQGEPTDYNVERKPLKPISEIKSNPNFATPGTEFKATESGESNQPDRVTVGDRAKESVKKAIKLSVLGPIKDNLYE